MNSGSFEEINAAMHEPHLDGSHFMRHFGGSPATPRHRWPMGPSETPVVTDTELRDLTIASLNAAGYGDDVPFTVETVEDVDAFHAIVCNAIPAGWTHAIRHLSVWPSADQADALITLDLPNGLRLATLCVTVAPFRPSDPQDTGTDANVEAALSELLYRGHMIAEQFEVIVQSARTHYRRRTLRRALSKCLQRIRERG
jgi:hypothetical protein